MSSASMAPVVLDTPGGAYRPLTAGRAARYLNVDLKTVHNWARNGSLACWRTNGRHLRIHPVEVVRKLRQRKLPIPSEVAERELRLVAAGLHLDAPDLHATRLDCIFSALMAFGTQDYDALIVHLDRAGPIDLAELVQAVRGHELTRGRGLVGLSADPAICARFLAMGADECAVSANDLRAAVHWVAGTSSVRLAHTSTPPIVPTGAAVSLNRWVDCAASQR